MEELRSEGEFDGIVDRYCDRVLRLCYLYMRNQPDAEDACQNVFVKLCTAPPAFRDERHVRAWLVTVAKNECRSLLRSFWRRRVVCTDDVVRPVQDPRSREVMRAVLNLPLRYRGVVYLHYYAGYSVQELAQMLRLKEPTVKTRLMRGRGLLRQALQQGGFAYE